MLEKRILLERLERVIVIEGQKGLGNNMVEWIVKKSSLHPHLQNSKLILL